MNSNSRTPMTQMTRSIALDAESLREAIEQAREINHYGFTLVDDGGERQPIDMMEEGGPEWPRTP